MTHYLVVLLTFVTAIVLSLIGLERATESTTRLRHFSAPENEVTMYVDPITGSDSPSGGRTINTPLATLEQALLNFDQTTAIQCTVILLSSVTIAEPLSVFPASRQCKRISITAPRIAVHNDVVTAITSVRPNSYNWSVITLQTGGLQTNAYQRKFVENLMQQRIYVVESNSAATVDSIAGYVDADAPIKPFDEPNQLDAWQVGDQVELFDVSVAIQWTGVLLIDMPYNTIIFSNVQFLPQTATSYIRFPDIENQVEIRGAYIECRASICTQGRVSLFGVYATNDNNSTASAFISDTVYDRCARFESVWLERINLFRGGICAVLFFKANDAFSSLDFTGGGVFVGYSLKYENGDGITIFLNAPTRFLLYRIYVAKIAGTSANLRAINFDNGVTAVMKHVEIDCVLPFCVSGILLGKRCFLDLSGHVRVSAPQTLLTFASAVFHINDPESFVIAGASATATFQFAGQSIAVFDFYRTVSNISTLPPSGGAFAIVLVSYGTVVLRGPSTNYYWATPSGSFPLVRSLSGGHLIDATTGSGMSVQGNKGAVLTAVLRCGLLAISDWSISQFDTNNLCTRN